MSRLTGKQKLFADAYIITLNATESARRAGYAGNDATLSTVGYENLRKLEILEYVREQLDRYAMSASEVLVQLTDIARGDIADALNSMGGIDPLEAKRRGKSHLIKRFKAKTITTEDSDIQETEIEMHDRLAALTLLAKYHDLVNKVRIEDWRSQAVADIRAGTLAFDVLAKAFDEDLATELFRAAGVPISTE